MDDQRFSNLENRVKTIEDNAGRNISSVEKKVTDDNVSDGIYETLWNKVYHVASFASASITTTGTNLLDANGRESDTTAGRLSSPSRDCKFKTAFYLDTGFNVSTVYITSPAISAVSTVGSFIVDSDKSFVGIKIINGAINLVSCRSGVETVKTTTTTIINNNTNVLEIDYYITHAIILFNDVQIGDIACNLLGITFQTFFPFLTSLSSNDTSSVNLTIENYEFIQKRK